MMKELRNIVCRGLLVFLVLFLSQCAHHENSYEGLVDNFNEHEEDFSELIATFSLQLKHHDTGNYQMELTVGQDRDSIFIGRTPYIINEEPGEQPVRLWLRKGTPEYRNGLKELGWTEISASRAGALLRRVNCKTIRSVNYSGGCQIEILPEGDDAFVSHSYLYYERPITGDSVKTYGKPVSHSAIGRHCTVSVISVL
ncbi:hypothetical protein [Prevotella sp. KH2C16]|uniref:hypothetical protein n=1 Tax=Prevotella sp. KH2C16 TaxID=1855325 RepID=UPI0008DF1F39|nr:hypothetical protein [Prevotella sp. KH2C16]SFG22979.1 hypothetical protein SAMN05216383_107121 [Prevotella sp. KH2C16]